MKSQTNGKERPLHPHTCNVSIFLSSSAYVRPEGGRAIKEVCECFKSKKHMRRKEKNIENLFTWKKIKTKKSIPQPTQIQD